MTNNITYPEYIAIYEAAAASLPDDQRRHIETMHRELRRFVPTMGDGLAAEVVCKVGRFVAQNWQPPNHVDNK